MTKFKFSISIDGFTQFVIIESNNRADAERLVKVQYATAKYIRFAGTVQ
jgi:RNA-binding protein YhbY|tara:strand:+ start:345 stop:491 length:147 start_codon:yes stop_codon:yes gene_type:complete